MQKANIIILLFCFALVLASCEKSKTNTSKPVAKVYDKYLYISDIEEIFPQNISPADSIQILNGYIDRWIRKQLLLYRAEKNLSDNQKDVSKQIEDYRSSLLIFKYEQEFIRQKLDTIIPYDEIEDFYNENTSNFTLNESIVKALFIKLKLDDPYLDRIKGLYRSNKEEDIKTLDNLAYQVAIKYDYFNDQWIPYSRILRELPEQMANPETYLLTNKSIEMRDDNFVYFVSFRDVMHRGQQSPLVYEMDNIRNILINKRKRKLIIDLESNIYNDARNHNHFSIFTNK
jgi:uncharacterized damage-inducible protein DinB